MSQPASAVIRQIAVPIAAALAAVSIQSLTARRAAIRARILRDLAEAHLALAEKDALTSRLKPITEVFEVATELGKRMGWEDCRAAGQRHGIVTGSREPRIVRRQDSEAS